MIKTYSRRLGRTSGRAPRADARFCSGSGRLENRVIEVIRRTNLTRQYGREFSHSFTKRTAGFLRRDGYGPFDESRGVVIRLIGRRQPATVQFRDSGAPRVVQPNCDFQVACGFRRQLMIRLPYRRCRLYGTIKRVDTFGLNACTLLDSYCCNFVLRRERHRLARRRPRIRPAESSCRFGHCQRGSALQEIQYFLAGNRWKTFQKIVNRFASQSIPCKRKNARSKRKIRCLALGFERNLPFSVAAPLDMVAPDR